MGYTDADRELANTAGVDIGLGCGNPVGLANLQKGEDVLDLGCGAGLDCLLAAREVGRLGTVVGIDMVPDWRPAFEEAAKKARSANKKLASTRFVEGHLETLSPIADASVDVIISNCVVNLSEDKPAVFREAFRVLRCGGRLAISDVVRTAELPQRLKNDASLCCWVAGAPLPSEMGELLRAAGFEAIVVEEKKQSASYISEWLPGSGAENFVVSANVTATKPASGGGGWQPAAKKASSGGWGPAPPKKAGAASGGWGPAPPKKEGASGGKKAAPSGKWC